MTEWERAGPSAVHTALELLLEEQEPDADAQWERLVADSG